MKKLEAKQLKKYLSAPIIISGLTASGLNDIITTDLTSVLTTSGFKNTAITLQPSTNEETIGVIVEAPNNRVDIWDNTTKKKIETINGNEVYGRLTHNTGVYTLTYYYIDNDGDEQAYSFSSTDIIILFNYRYELHKLPTDAFIKINTKFVNQDPNGGSSNIIKERLEVIALNNLSDLSFAPLSNNVVSLYVNGQKVDYITPNPPFTVVGTTITWSNINTGYDLDLDDIIFVEYKV